jgi:glycosyltransferase involved in cell wall biosynthesis
MNISVYITSYNQKAFLKEAIDSVLAQTLLPNEIVIIDDASTDGSQDLIQEYCLRETNIISHFNKENKGITKNRNLALSLVTGDLITWLDGDDVYLPDKLKTQFELIQQTNADLVYTNFYISEDQIDSIKRVWCSDISQLPQGNNILKEVLSRNFPRNALFRYEMITRDLLNEIGGYDEKIDIYEDFEYRIRLAEKANTAFSMKALSIYRLHGKGLSNKEKSVHLSCLNYIHEKHKKLILNFNPKEQEQINNSIAKYLSNFKDKKISEDNTLKLKIKRKLKRLIDKI